MQYSGQCNNISTLFSRVDPMCLQIKRSNWGMRVANKMFYMSLHAPPRSFIFSPLLFLLVLFFHGITGINRGAAEASGLTNKCNECWRFHSFLSPASSQSIFPIPCELNNFPLFYYATHWRNYFVINFSPHGKCSSLAFHCREYSAKNIIFELAFRNIFKNVAH